MTLMDMIASGVPYEKAVALRQYELSQRSPAELSAMARERLARIDEQMRLLLMERSDLLMPSGPQTKPSADIVWYKGNS